MSRTTWVAAALVLAAAVGVSLWWWIDEDSFPPSQTLSGQTALLLPSENPALRTTVSGGDGVVSLSATQWESWLFTQSSLRGASLDGAWGELGPDGLLPSLALRRRFDQLLSTRGELNSAELRAMVHAIALRDLGSDAAKVMAIWDRYVALLDAPLTTRLDPRNPQQWLQVLREEQAQRNQILGSEWARAFFAEEDAYLVSTVERLLQGEQPTLAEPWQARPSDVSTEQWHAQRQQALGNEAARSLAALDQEFAAWEQRVDAARQIQASLAARAELSEQQRQQELHRWIDAQFSGRERIRVRALLGGGAER